MAATAEADGSTDATYPYVAELEISFPTVTHAEYTCKVLEVDSELGDRIKRTATLDLHENVKAVMRVCVLCDGWVFRMVRYNGSLTSNSFDFNFRFTVALKEQRQRCFELRYLLITTLCK